MTPPAHFASGYLIYRVAAFLGATQTSELFIFSLLGAFAPDIDGLFFGKRMNNHRNTLFHTPFFWTLLFVIALFALWIFRLNYFAYTLVFFAGAFAHLFMDWVSARTGGVPLFYPVSKKTYSLFPLCPERGEIPVLPNRGYKNFWKFYFQNKFLIAFEFSIIFAALGLSLT